MQACHKYVRDVAMAAAGEFYEEQMVNNRLYDLWKENNPGLTPKQREKKFINTKWPHFVEFARQTMALLLQQEDVSPEVKEQIYEVFLLENTIPGRANLSPAKLAAMARSARE